MVLAGVVIVASTVVMRLDGPPGADPAMPDEAPLEVALLSVRRNLEPLRDAAADHELREDLDRFVASQPQDTCLQVEAGPVRYDHRGADPQTPASLQKLATAIAALTEIGAEETFETDALSAPVTGGIVPGNLYLRGGGDPILATGEYLARERNQPQIHTDIARLADAIVASGVTTIVGSVVGDDSRYDVVRYNPELPSRFIAQGQVGPISALSVNDGFAHFPGQQGVFGPAPDPAAYAATILDGLLRARGVAIGGPPISGTTPPEAVVTASISSPPMTQIVTQMLRESDNNTAEMLLKEIGLRRGGEGSFATGQSAVVAILEEAGLPVEAINVVDGSGLGPDNALTCDLVIDLLEHQPFAEEIRSALAVAGESGTLSRRWLDTELVGRVRAKTGTLNTVTALAGFAETDGAGMATFAMVVNLQSGAVTAEMVAAQRDLAEALVAYPDLPDVEALAPSAVGNG